jgi:hypothetical protein
MERLSVLFVIIISFLFACNSAGDKKTTSNEPRKALNLLDPKPEAADPAKPRRTDITIIPLREKEWWCYFGADVEKGTIYDPTRFRKMIEKKKKERGDDLIVVIKSLPNSSYQAQVDALDEMLMLQVKQYTVASPSAHEIAFFNEHPEAKDKPSVIEKFSKKQDNEH